MTQTETAQALVRLLSRPAERLDPAQYGQPEDIIYQRKRRSRPSITGICPYIGVAGSKVDLHTSDLYPGFDHVGFVPQKSPGTITGSGGGGGIIR